MKNFILSTAFLLGAIGANAGTAVEANPANAIDIFAEDGCTTTTVSETVTNADGSSRTVTISVEVCD